MYGTCHYRRSDEGDYGGREGAVMSRREWWIGIVLIGVALLGHVALPRYDVMVSDHAFVRVDRWTGHVEVSDGGWETAWLTVDGTE